MYYFSVRYYLSILPIDLICFDLSRINLRIECHLNRTPIISTIYVHSGTKLQDLKEQVRYRRSNRSISIFLLVI